MIKEVKRLAEILKVLKKNDLFKLFRLTKPNKLNKNALLVNNNLAVNIRLAIEELGPIYIKFGQLLSTRHEILPSNFINEFAKLQDSVKAFPTENALNIINSELNQDYNKIFTDFNLAPIAAASVAQVYEAKLDNKEVVVKILRPNLKNYIAQDIKLLKFVLRFITKIYPGINRLKLNELILELERVLIYEQDLLKEAANASQLRRNFSSNKLLYIPKVYWKYCTSKILVLEKIAGVSVHNIEELKKHNVDLELLAKRGLEIFFTQVFEHCLFHGDLHPGNIFVNLKQANNPTFYAVDFGIIGSLGPLEQYYLAANLQAFLNRDYRRIAELHIESGWVDRDTRVDLFEGDIRSVSEPVLEKSVNEISFGELLVKLFDVGKKYNLQLQPQLLVFKKSLINVEGIARQLYPDLDLWNSSKPFIEKFMREQIEIKNIYTKIKSNIPVWTKIFLEAPELLYTYLNNNKNKYDSSSSSSSASSNKSTNSQGSRIYNFDNDNLDSESYNNLQSNCIDINKSSQQYSLLTMFITKIGKFSSIKLAIMAVIVILLNNYDSVLFLYSKYINNTSIISNSMNFVALFILLFALNNYYKKTKYLRG